MLSSDANRIYLDHNATTKPAPEVVEAATWAAGLANPSSLHAEGRAARQALEVARRQVAALLEADPAEVIFTSSATEANNTGILGAARAARRRGRPAHLVTGPLEHPSVLKPLSVLVSEGFTLDRLPVDPCGRIDPDDLRRLLRERPAALVTLQLVNHELGNINPLAEVARVCREHGALLHCDAVQGVGRLPLDRSMLAADLLSVSAHKLGGLKGAGALIVRRPTEIEPLLLGGHQERGRRAGTENLPALVGFGVACARAQTGLEERARRVAMLRDRLEAQLLALPGARRNGDGERRVPGTCNVAFDGVEGQVLMMALDLRGVACSTGAACSSGSPEPSPVLLALGQPPLCALEAVRFSLSETNTEEEVDQVVVWVQEIVARARSV